MTEPRPWATCMRNFVKFGFVVFELYEWTDKEADIIVTILCTPSGSKVMKSLLSLQCFDTVDWVAGRASGL